MDNTMENRFEKNMEEMLSLENVKTIKEMKEIGLAQVEAWMKLLIDGFEQMFEAEKLIELDLKIESKGIGEDLTPGEKIHQEFNKMSTVREKHSWQAIFKGILSELTRDITEMVESKKRLLVDRLAELPDMSGNMETLSAVVGALEAKATLIVKSEEVREQSLDYGKSRIQVETEHKGCLGIDVDEDSCTITIDGRIDSIMELIGDWMDFM